MIYTKITVNCPSNFSEALLGLLSQIPFEVFEELDDGVVAYIKKEEWSPSLSNFLTEILDPFSLVFVEEEIPYQNWNKEWESNFEPIVIPSKLEDDIFCSIRAEFHDPISAKFPMVIRPKMAFGTGHHATTFQMIQAMESLTFEGKSVFDFGCGTGILAILAEQMGAESIYGIDNEGPAIRNSIEHATMNKTPKTLWEEGELEKAAGKKFDIILANINRHIILQSIETLYTQLNSKGKILISGIMLSDIPLILEAFAKAGFNLLKTNKKEDWACILFTKA